MAPAWTDLASVAFESALGMAKLVGLALAACLLLGPLVRRRKIRPAGISPRTLAHEIAFGTTTLLVGGLVSAVMGLLHGRDVLALAPAVPPPGTLALEVAGYFVAFDLYFYLLHRLLHRPRLFARIHWVHHRAPVPSPLTAIAFHPVEALLTGAFLPLTLLVVPLHAFSVLLIGTLQLLAVLFVHSGYEPFPQAWHRVWPLHLCITPLVHDVHHTRFDRNFGAYTTVWDRLFGTLDENAVGGFYRRLDAASEAPATTMSGRSAGAASTSRG
jgi:sterol desaturase/sphingolipid hydroxylase (fatty acid hydroxylase superfamily)